MNEERFFVVSEKSYYLFSERLDNLVFLDYILLKNDKTFWGVGHKHRDIHFIKVALNAR